MSKKVLTTTEFRELCDKMYTVKKLAEQSKKDFTELKQEIIDYLVDHELDDFSAKTCKVILQSSENASVPKDNLDKKLLFDFIKKKYGAAALMNKLVINPKSFAGFYKEELATSDELDFSMPGVAKPFEKWTIQVRKK